MSPSCRPSLLRSSIVSTSSTVRSRKLFESGETSSPRRQVLCRAMFQAERPMRRARWRHCCGPRAPTATLPNQSA
eukprot:4674387-Lingulodinium_polyedra.AAC.1